MAETGAEKRAKGFTCWQQFVGMLLCQLGQAHSLREICGGLSSCLGKLKNPGIESAPINDHSCNIEGQMADRDIFQDYKAESEDKDICWDKSQCINDTDLDSIDIYTGIEVSDSSKVPLAGHCQISWPC